MDESTSDYVTHPLAQAYLEAGCPGGSADLLMKADADAKFAARNAYTLFVACLERWLIARGVDRLSARKQARGVGRGYLGNALQTDLIFSASVQQWKWMLGQRATAAADAEIRQLFVNDLDSFGSVLTCLQSSRYGEAFADYRIEASPDGIGYIAAVG